MDDIKNCLTCRWEPEWFENVDIFNDCPHCNTHTVGICKKLALIVPVLGEPISWPDTLLNAYSWAEKVGNTVYRAKNKKREPYFIKNCPGHQPKGGGEE